MSCCVSSVKKRGVTLGPLTKAHHDAPAPHSGRGVRQLKLEAFISGRKERRKIFLRGCNLKFMPVSRYEQIEHTSTFLPDKAVTCISKLDQLLRNDTYKRQDNR
jgi:hypothetical protein